MKANIVKKICCLCMTAVLLAGAAGCGQQDDGGSSSVSNAAGGQEETGGEESVEDKELVTVKVLCQNDYDAEIKTENWEEYAVSQEVIADLEELGIRLELECIDNLSFVNTVNTRMASGMDMPDLVAYVWPPGSADQDVIAWAESGLLYSVNELVEQYDEDGSIRAFYDEKAPHMWEKNTLNDGNLYWFSYLAGPQKKIVKETGETIETATPFSLSIRKDWVEAVGEEVKECYAPDELLELLKKMQDQDVNGNGAADEIACVGIEHFSNGIATGFGLSRELLAGYFEGEDKVFSNFYHENFPAYIEFMQKLYQSGLYDTKLFSMTVEEGISEGTAALVYNYAETEYELSLIDPDPDTVYYVPIMLDWDGDSSNGIPMMTDSTGANSFAQYFVPKSTQNAEAVMRLMDYIYSDRYAVLDQFGVEGKGYEVDENGNYVLLPANGKESTNFKDASAGMYALPAQNVIVPVVSMEPDPSLSASMKYKKEWQYHFYTDIFPNSVQPLEFTHKLYAMPTVEEQTLISEKEAVLWTYAQELLTDLILGNKSLDDLPKYLEEMEELGLKDYVAVFQARHDRIMNAQ